MAFGKRTALRSPRSRALYGVARRSRPLSKQKPDSHLFAWAVVIVILAALAIASWTLPSYVFQNPQSAFNYGLLSKLKKLEAIRRFDALAQPDALGGRRRADPTQAWPPPKGDFLTAPEIFNGYSGYSAKELAALSSRQKKNYIQNFKDEKVLGYVTGQFIILAVKPLEGRDFFPGLALRTQSVDFPNLILEYLMPARSLPANVCKPGDKLSVEKAASLAAIVHLQHLPNARLCVSAIPLNYQDRALVEGSVLDLEPPEKLNLRAPWPATGTE